MHYSAGSEGLHIHGKCKVEGNCHERLVLCISCTYMTIGKGTMYLSTPARLIANPSRLRHAGFPVQEYRRVTKYRLESRSPLESESNLGPYHV